MFNLNSSTVPLVPIYLVFIESTELSLKIKHVVNVNLSSSQKILFSFQSWDENI